MFLPLTRIIELDMFISDNLLKKNVVISTQVASSTTKHNSYEQVWYGYVGSAMTQSSRRSPEIVNVIALLRALISCEMFYLKPAG